jgi:hypothetical protein
VIGSHTSGSGASTRAGDGRTVRNA